MNPTSPDQLAETASIPAVNRPGTLYVAGPPGADIQPLIQILEQAGLNQQSARDGQHRVSWQMLANSDPQSIAAKLQTNADSHLLLFYRAATPVLAEAMEQGRSPDEALDEWLAQAEAILGMIRQNRRHITLVELTRALEEPTTLIERLGQRLSLTFNAPRGESGGQTADLDAIYRLIAHAAVMNNTHARLVAAELEATALPVGSEELLLPEALSAWKAYHKRPGEVEPEQLESIEELREENELLLLQLHQVQEELESYYLEGRDLDGNYQQLEAQKNRLEKDNRAIKQRAEVLQQKIDKMRKSTSWRLTKPLRGVGKFFRRNRYQQG